MKKITIMLIFLLAALLTMAGSSNPEKLKMDDNDWDKQWYFTYHPDSTEEGVFTLKVNMLLHHDIAKAALNNGKFSILVTALDHDGNGWDTTNPVEVDNDEWDKDAKFIPITGFVEWNGDDDGSGIVESVFITLFGPSGKALSSTIEAKTGGVLIHGPDYEEPPSCGDEFPCPGTP